MRKDGKLAPHLKSASTIAPAVEDFVDGVDRLVVVSDGAFVEGSEVVAAMEETTVGVDPGEVSLCLNIVFLCSK